MELRKSLFGSTVSEGQIYFFSSDCPVGVADHMHVCIKHADRILLLSTCSSEIDTAMRIARCQGYDLNTFPVFTQNSENRFAKPQTYINCNRVVELSEEQFGDLYSSGKIIKLKGFINEQGLSLIAKGIGLSPDIEGRIKKMFL